MGEGHFRQELQRKLDMSKTTPGRPPKFAEPSRPVTVTLPERILAKLQVINKDRGLAITRIVDNLVPDSRLNRPLLEIVPISGGQGLIVIPFSKVLSKMPEIQLVEISPLRHIISLQQGRSVDSFELAVMDALDCLPADEASEAALLRELLEILAKIRRKHGMKKAEILLVSPD